MNTRNIRQQLQDFKMFCDTVDIKQIVASADNSGSARGYEKELYAIAIIRAAHLGSFGDDDHWTQRAISALWEKGYRSGFTRDSFNSVCQKYFRYC